MKSGGGLGPTAPLCHGQCETDDVGGTDGEDSSELRQGQQSKPHSPCRAGPLPSKKRLKEVEEKRLDRPVSVADVGLQEFLLTACVQRCLQAEPVCHILTKASSLIRDVRFGLDSGRRQSCAHVPSPIFLAAGGIGELCRMKTTRQAGAKQSQPSVSRRRSNRTSERRPCAHALHDALNPDVIVGLPKRPRSAAFAQIQSDHSSRLSRSRPICSLGTSGPS